MQISQRGNKFEARWYIIWQLLPEFVSDVREWKIVKIGSRTFLFAEDPSSQNDCVGVLMARSGEKIAQLIYKRPYIRLNPTDQTRTYVCKFMSVYPVAVTSHFFSISPIYNLSAEQIPIQHSTELKSFAESQ